jgi:hypothetical protein
MSLVADLPVEFIQLEDLLPPPVDAVVMLVK